MAEGGYAVLEIMGHRQIPGFVSEVVESAERICGTEDSDAGEA